MKKFILPALIVGTLTLFSFTKPTGGGVQKIAKNLYLIEKGADINEEDANLINKSIQLAYKISDVELKQISSTGMDMKALAGKAIFSKKWNVLSLLDEHFVVWDDPAEPTTVEENIEALRVIEKYSR